MGAIIPITKIKAVRERITKQGKSLCLVGGCFDVLHPGHVVFLHKAKKAADYLIVLLESDQKVKKLKGERRPVHDQKMRAKVLSNLTSVDLVVMLPFMEKKSQYDELILKIKPDVIAVTSGYPDTDYHRRAADLVGAKLKYVTKMIGNHSTSKILNHNNEVY
ncbi:adenylyltransferase/cytidyltransferase family protein [Candidatus Microgenomates bacterium]|nr:adenylyltransferase/cytidyltransferase family protein [Candidatus Microgenomates bacterium]